MFLGLCRVRKKIGTKKIFLRTFGEFSCPCDEPKGEDLPIFVEENARELSKLDCPDIKDLICFVLYVNTKIRQSARLMETPMKFHQMPECNGTTPPRVASLMDHQLTPARCVILGVERR